MITKQVMNVTALCYDRINDGALHERCAPCLLPSTALRSCGMSSSGGPSSPSERVRTAFFRGAHGERYELLQHLGRGAYGEVWAAHEKAARGHAGSKVAIKKITN